MDYSKKTLGELLSHANDIIKRNAISILKQLQRKKDNGVCLYCGYDMYGTVRIHHHAEIIDGKEIDVTN